MKNDEVILQIIPSSGLNFGYVWIDENDGTNVEYLPVVGFALIESVRLSFDGDETLRDVEALVIGDSPWGPVSCREFVGTSGNTSALGLFIGNKQASEVEVSLEAKMARAKMKKKSPDTPDTLDTFPVLKNTTTLKQ